MLVAHGLTFTDEFFTPTLPHTYCRICGKVYQPVNNNTVPVRKEWSRRHARSHPEWLHRQLANSGLWAFPEAAHKLAAFGIVPLKDLVLNEEVASALKESKPIITSGLEY